jgi:vitamin B12 transporter
MTIRCIDLRRTALAVALSVAIQPAFAASPDDEAVVVVTATRQPTRIDTTVADITVVTRAQIEDAGQSTLPELLARQPGVQASSRGGGAAGIYLRGNSEKHTLLLVDGVRLGSATTGSPELSSIPLADIERIEILRGPASALYGSDAIGGVIHIITRKGKGPLRVTGEAGYGSYGTWRLGGSLTGSDERWSYALAAGHERSEGYNSVTNPTADAFNPDADGYRTDRASGRLELKLAPGHSLGANLLHVSGVQRFDSADAWAAPPVLASYDHRYDFRNETASIWMKNRFGDAWTSTLRIGSGRNDYRHQKSAVATDRFQTEQLQVSWQNDVALPLGDALLVAEQNEERITSTTAYDRTRRKVVGLLAGWRAELGDHHWQLSMRRDDNSQFGGKTTGSAGYGLTLAPGWRLGASVATAYKAPTFNDLYWPGAGNPDLKPEQARNRELFLAFERGTAKATATLYRNDVHDLIEWAPVGGGLWLPSNVARARIEGLTLAGEHVWGPWQGRASVDWLDARNAVTDKFLRYRSQEAAQLSLAYRAGGWQAGAEVSLYGKRYDDSANTVRLDSYGLLNLFAERSLGRDMTLFGRINNVFDERYLLVKSAYDYGVPGRSVFIGLRYTPR